LGRGSLALIHSGTCGLLNHGENLVRSEGGSEKEKKGVCGRSKENGTKDERQGGSLDTRLARRRLVCYTSIDLACVYFSPLTSGGFMFSTFVIRPCARAVCTRA